MKKALLTKLTLMLTVFAMLFYAVAFAGMRGASAATVKVSAENISSFFKDADGAEISLDGNDLKVTVTDGGTFAFYNQLVADDLAIAFSVPETVEKVTITLTSDEYATGGFANGTGETENVFVADIAGDKISLNDISENAELAAGEITVGFSVANGVLTARVGDVETANEADDLTKKMAGKDKHPVSVSFSFDLAEDAENADVLINYVDQKASEDGYKQGFKTDDGTVAGKIETIAKARVSMTTMPIKAANGKLIPVKDYKYTFAFKAYSLFGSVDDGDVYFSKDNANMNFENKDKPKTVTFTNDEEMEIYLCTSSVEELEKYVVAAAKIRENDDTAPEYLDREENEEIYDNYQLLAEKAAKADYDGEEYSIRLGDDYTIPSLEDLVYDDYDAYSSLTYTVYYRTPSSSTGSTTGMSFTVSEAGDYIFYVVFKDKNGNSMDKDAFIVEDDNGNEEINEGAAVFTFNVQDDAPLYVIAPASQGNGYVGTKYTATDFEIKSSGNNVTYTLKYNADVNATENSDGWTEIPKAADATDDERAKAVDYDGKYTFTPDKIGSYMIECVATSVTNVRSSSDSSIIRVLKEKTEVKPDTHWLQNNVWSVVFLSIGTLALIGIIVLLFIKPKDATETDATGDALKEKKQK